VLVVKCVILQGSHGIICVDMIQMTKTWNVAVPERLGSGWWSTYPSEKYEFVSYYSQYMEK
jgi:hypothetical protein